MKYNYFTNKLPSLLEIATILKEDTLEPLSYKERIFLENVSKEEEQIVSKSITNKISDYISKKFNLLNKNEIIKECFASKGNIENIFYLETFMNKSFISYDAVSRKDLEIQSAMKRIEECFFLCKKHKNDFEKAFKTNKKSLISVYVAVTSGLATYIATFQSRINLQLNNNDGNYKDIFDRYDEIENRKNIEELFFLEERLDYFIKEMRSNKTLDNLLLEFSFLSIGKFFGPIGTAISIFIMLIFNARDILEFIFNCRSRLSDWVKLQGTLLEFNSSKLNEEQTDPKVIEKQKHLAKLFFELSDKIKIDMKKSLKDTQENLISNDKEISDTIQKEMHNKDISVNTTETIL